MFSALFAAFVLLFGILAVLDFKDFAVSFWLLVLFLVAGFALGGVEDSFYGILEGLALCGIFALLKVAYKALRKKDALGDGDLVFLAALGAALGLAGALFAVVLGAVICLILLGIIFSFKRKIPPKIPFITLCFVGFLAQILLESFL